MARKKKKSGKKKPRSSSRFSRFIWIVIFGLIVLFGLYQAGRHFGLIPYKGPAEIDALALVKETLAALEAEPSIGEFKSGKITQVGRDKRYRFLVELSTDTEIILAEKIIQDFWESEGLEVAVTYPEDDQGGSVRIQASQRGKAGAKETVMVASLVQWQARAPEPRPEPTLPRPASAKNGPRIAIIIDDMGYNLELARRFLDIPYDLTLSILPYEIYSEDVLAMAASKGREVMLHMPMEPVDYPATDPGQGALLLSMTSGQVEKTLIQALDSLPGVAGVNNHMGSAFTADDSRMRAVMGVLESRGLYFIDSRTTKHTIGFILAGDMMVPTAERKVFLDNIREQWAIRQKLIELCNRADEDGQAIGIGHPYPETIAVLEQIMPGLAAAGYEIVPASEIAE